MNKKYKRIVVKVGSSVITYSSGKLNLTMIDNIVRQLVDLKNRGKEIIVVTSGAIGAGMGELGLDKRPKLITEQQAMAAIGQGLLIGVYNKFLREYGERGAQILLTSSDLEDRTRYLNAFNTLMTLLEYGVIPIVNENDTVATAEIKFGDNDTLSAKVAGLAEADLLINLSDVEGLYKGDFLKKRKKDIIRKVEKITPEIESLAGSKGSEISIGGMVTKIEAAKIAVESGITMVIGPGYRKNVIIDIVNMLENNKKYDIGTTFLPTEDTLSKRKQWLSFNLPICGSLVVDKGAEEAIVKKGKSLLPGGIVEVIGSFPSGSLVKILNEEGKEIGRGLVDYSSSEIEKIKRHHSSEIFSILGYVNQEEVIHRRNLVIGV
ncbi:MAG: glutamate 5-kinase [candidate division WOR-3 bacterium]